jgi:hypothetical protein
VVLFIFEKLSVAFTGLWKDALMLLIFGGVIGVLQSIVLRRHYSKSRWWIPASAIGFLFPLVMIANPSSTNLSITGMTALTGTFWGLVTGLVLVQMKIVRKN